MYKYLNEKFINTTFKTKIELYILTLLMFYLFYFFYTKIDFFENKASVENSFNMENLNKKYEGTTLLLLSDIEAISQKNSVAISFSSNDLKNINLKGNIKKENILNYISQIENLNNFTKIELFKLSKLDESTFFFETKISIDKFYIKKLIKKEKTDTPSIKNSQHKLIAIIDNYAFIDDVWIKKYDDFYGYKLVEIKKSSAVLENEFEKLSLEIKHE